MEKSPELAALLAEWFRAASSGDTGWIERHVSRRAESRLVGTDPTEWLAGDDVVDFLAREARAFAGQVSIDPGTPEAYRVGDVGWGITRPTIRMPSGMEIRPRWSAVFHREDGQWKMVQIHASLGISNADAGFED